MRKERVKAISEEQHSCLGNEPHNESATGAERVQTLWRALEETAKPIKNVLVPFLIILEEK